MNEEEKNLIVPQENDALVNIEQSRAIAEIQGAMAIAKKFPRNQTKSIDRILLACARPGLAEVAMYSYARGGTEITGPSIRLAETIAQNWGNIQFGIQELEQSGGFSTVQAYAWDLETNVRQIKTFQVPHIRYTKRGSYGLSDPRDIYELIANAGARRLRACVLGIIPGDIIEEAVAQCESTLKTKVSITPEKITSLLEKFAAYSIIKEQIEKRIQRRVDTITPAQMVQLGKIYNSLKDGMSVAADWFEIEKIDTTATLKDKLRPVLTPDTQNNSTETPDKPKRGRHKKETEAEPESPEMIAAENLFKATEGMINEVLDEIAPGGTYPSRGPISTLVLPDHPRWTISKGWETSLKGYGIYDLLIARLNKCAFIQDDIERILSALDLDPKNIEETKKMLSDIDQFRTWTQKI